MTYDILDMVLVCGAERVELAQVARPEKEVQVCQLALQHEDSW